SGGFKGTAIKPIESGRRMTEHFGPCGVGWGMDKPEFQLVPIEGNGEIMVFCTVSIWYSEPSATPSPYRCSVYGVGGDKVVTRGAGGLRTSDEAFKSAYTDALGNAMKQIGMAADIHMGLFDDSKYVRDVRAEFAGDVERALEAPRRPAGDLLVNQAYDASDKGTRALRSFWAGLPGNRERMAICKKLRAEPQLGCPAILKQYAEEAYHKIATAQAESHIDPRYNEQYPAPEPERPPAPVDPPLQPKDATTPDFVVAAQEGGL